MVKSSNPHRVVTYGKFCSESIQDNQQPLNAVEREKPKLKTVIEQQDRLSIFAASRAKLTSDETKSPSNYENPNFHLCLVQKSRVDLRSGEQTLISQGGYLQRPQGLAVRGKNIYVTDVATLDMNFGVGRIIRVNANTGEQKVLSEGNYLVGPVGIAIEQDGQLIVGDPYTISPESPDLLDGGIIRIDKNTGAQELIARGSGNFVNPRGVAVFRGR